MHILDIIIFNEKVLILIKITLSFVSSSLFDNKWPLVQLMAWWRTGGKPLSEPMMTQFHDTYAPPVL